MAESKDCILFATADWETPYWTNKQHTTQQLAHQGYRVLYVESVGLRAPNLGSGRDLSRIARRLKQGLQGVRQVEDRIWVLSPLVLPFKHHRPLVRAFNQGLLAKVIQRFLTSKKFKKPMIWTYHPFMLEAINGIEMGPLVYHCVDDLSAIPGVDAAAFNQEEQRLLAAAKAVFTTSPALMAKCSAHNPNVHNFPNVADFTHFSQALQKVPLPADLQALSEPRIGYIGVLSDYKVDFQLIINVASHRPEWSFVLIGEEREGQSSPLVDHLRTLPNVHFLGYRAYKVLPDYLGGFNVALLPTLINDYTHSMFPMKYFEYLAAGVPVVSTPLEFTREHNAGLEIGGDAKSFELAILRQLQRGKFSTNEAADYVGLNTWATRMNSMLQIVEASS